MTDNNHGLQRYEDEAPVDYMVRSDDGEWVEWSAVKPKIDDLTDRLAATELRAAFEAGHNLSLRVNLQAAEARCADLEAELAHLRLTPF